MCVHTLEWLVKLRVIHVCARDSDKMVADKNYIIVLHVNPIIVGLIVVLSAISFRPIFAG